MVDRPDPRPLNITIWGGQTDLAQALWRVRADRGGDGLKQFVERIRVYDIGDQDRIVEWIWTEFPGLFYVLGQAAKGRDKRESVYRGMYLGGDQALTSREWMETNIRQSHGPLGALYPTRTWTAPNPHSAIKEGDTPSWFYFLPNGLNVPDHPTWGGWGGRFVKSQRSHLPRCPGYRGKHNRRTQHGVAVARRISTRFPSPHGLVRQAAVRSQSRTRCRLQRRCDASGPDPAMPIRQHDQS